MNFQDLKIINIKYTLVIRNNLKLMFINKLLYYNNIINIKNKAKNLIILSYKYIL